MLARLASVPQTGDPRWGLRVLGGLTAALVIGLSAGYLSASLTSRSASKVVSRGPVTSVTAPSTGAYGDRDSRLPIAAGSSLSAVYGDRDSRLPIATTSSISAGSVWGDHDSRLPYLTTSGAALMQGIMAHVIALQGMAGIGLSKVPGAAAADHDSRPPVAPFTGR
jgi:hypothetical protein